MAQRRLDIYSYFGNTEPSSLIVTFTHVPAVIKSLNRSDKYVTTDFGFLNFSILLVQCVNLSHTIVIANGDCFPKQH
jgi:hypothetical protein